MMQEHITDFQGNWMENYKGHGSAWTPRAADSKLATDARCSPNMGPPTRVCACKPKVANSGSCATHDDCASGYCKGAGAKKGDSNGMNFLPQVGKCRTQGASGEACSIHEDCKTGFCNGGTGKCDKVSWSNTNGAAVKGYGRLSSPWCLSNGPHGCALVLSMVGAGIHRPEAIAKAQNICASIDDCNSVWCCTTGCTNAICYGSKATSPNYKQKDCPGLKGSFLESKIPVQMWVINRPESHVATPNAKANSSISDDNIVWVGNTPTSSTVPRPFTPVKLDWSNVLNKGRSDGKNWGCFKSCGNRGGLCDWCGTAGACCQAGYIEWETGKPSYGCDEAITRSAGHNGFGCVPANKARPKKMHDAETGEALQFLPLEQRYTLPRGILQEKDNDFTGINFQVLLTNYQCGPPASTWGKQYHNHNTARGKAQSVLSGAQGWKSAQWCLTEAKKRGYKAIAWTDGWGKKGRRVGGIGSWVDPNYNCAFETTRDPHHCPEGFTKIKRKGTWYYVELLPDGPRPKMDGSFVLNEGSDVSKDAICQKDASKCPSLDKITPSIVQLALVTAVGTLNGRRGTPVQAQEIEVIDLEKHAGGGMLVRFVSSVDIVEEVLDQLSLHGARGLHSALRDETNIGHLVEPNEPRSAATPVTPAPKPKPPPRKGKRGGKRGGKRR